MNKKINLLFSLLLVLFLILPCTAKASSLYSNPETLCGVYIDDEADLLTADEELALVEHMTPITAFGEVCFHTVDSHIGGFDQYARDYYYGNFGNRDGVVFLIDMQERELTVMSGGKVYSVVTSGKARSITDNVYRKAGSGDYYGCAASAFDQIGSLLQGHRIAEPMRYITSALIAILIALLINFLRVRGSSRLNAAAIDAVAEAAGVKIDYGPAEASLLHQERVYSPVPKNTGGGGGGGGRIGGGGGGGFSGGGGSHKF